MYRHRICATLCCLAIPLFTACESMRDVVNGAMLAAAGALDIASGDANASATRAVGSKIMEDLDREDASNTKSFDEEDDATSSASTDNDDDSKVSDPTEQAATAAASGRSRLVQTLPPSTPPPRPRNDGTMRGSYLDAADQYDWAAGEYEKQGKHDKAEEMRREARKMRGLADSLKSNAPAVRGR